MADNYREDLAYIHDAGYTGFAQSAARVLLEALRGDGVQQGLVIDLGCGSGAFSEAMATAGYDILGIDISEAMIALARERVPRGEFRVESLLNAELPSCVGVASVGECINYLFDDDNSLQRLAALFRRIYQALSPGGFLLFDAAGPGRVPGPSASKSHAEGADWAALVTSEEDVKEQVVTRQITTFRRVGELYRRDREVHRERLYAHSELADLLQSIGFEVTVVRDYGGLPLLHGVVGFLARKRLREAKQARG